MTTAVIPDHNEKTGIYDVVKRARKYPDDEITVIASSSGY